MKLNALLFFLVYSTLCFAQSREDIHSLYAIVLNDRLVEFYGPRLDSLHSIIVIEKSQVNEGDLEFMDELIADPIKEYMFTYLYSQTGGDTIFIRKFKTDLKIKEAMDKFRHDNGVNSKIEPQLLKLNRNITINTVTLEKYHSYFKKGKNIDKAWRKILKTYSSRSIFELSKITFNQNYAVFYIEHLCGSLCASRDFVVMENVKGVWQLLTVLNLSMS